MVGSTVGHLAGAGSHGSFGHSAQQNLLQDYVDAVEDAEARFGRLGREIAEFLPTWLVALVVEAVQMIRGAAES
jgi:transposase